MATKCLSMQLSQQDLWNKAEKQKYVWIKTDDGLITKDDLTSDGLRTSMFRIFLHQETYGKTWAFTREELMEA